MDNAAYVALTRQMGLQREMTVLANNIANASTTGYRQEHLMFSEFVNNTKSGTSLSMSLGNVRVSNLSQGALTPTGGTLDLAIEGAGFFLVETADGPRLTRAGNFATNANGELVTLDGLRVLDASQAPVFIPPDATDIHVASDGTLSAGGRPLGEIGIFAPPPKAEMKREAGTLFSTETELQPATDSRVAQVFLEQSNVDTISQFARMIEVQRAYETGQSFLETEHERARNTLKSLIR
jgi:flagellar basal-body rod protein FlgF